MDTKSIAAALNDAAVLELTKHEQPASAARPSGRKSAIAKNI